MDANIQPSEIPKLTIPQLTAITCSPERENENMSWSDVIKHTREYQRTYLGRPADK